jgi:hypothetical protein
MGDCVLRHRVTRPGLFLYGVFGVMTLMPRAALAQPPARSFAELQSILKSGDDVQITDNSGTRTRGKVADVSMNSLGLTVDGRRRDLPEPTIREIKKRRPDSRWNGTLIGAAIGTAAGAFAKAHNCGATDCGEGGLVDPGFYFIGAAAGAGAGALVDGAIRKFDTVFAAAPAAPRFSLSVVLSRNVKGFELSVAF